MSRIPLFARLRTAGVRRPSAGSVLMPGALASLAYLGAQALDRRLLSNQYDDLVLWGGFVARTPARQKAAGAAVHFTLGTLLAALYAAVLPVLPRLPGPLLGVLFVQTENAILYPGVPVLNAIHPAVRRGELPPLTTGRYALVEILRHAAFGCVLGSLIRRDRT